MAAMPLTAKATLPTLRLKLRIKRGWRFRLWLTARILTAAGWAYGRKIEVEYDSPGVELNV